MALAIEVRALGVRLRAHRHVFTSGHRQGAGDHSRDTGDQDVVAGRIGSCDPDDEARGRHDPVVGSEHCRTQPPDPLTSMTLAMCHARILTDSLRS
jgi:hypothetical protein